jgi:PAT family beta-lactamase induction signal transducer AmpG
MADWRHVVKAYGDRRVLVVLAQGFASGLPLLLVYSTLSTWLTSEGVSRASVGLFLLVQAPYSFKFLWSPLIDRLPPPLPLGQRRGWAVSLQLALMAAISALGAMEPVHHMVAMGALAVLVAFLSASQDIVIDAYRIETLDDAQQGPGAGAYQAGYRLGLMAAGAGALLLASAFGWFAAYVAMATLLGVGVGVFLWAPEPPPRPTAEVLERERRVVGYLAENPHLRGQRAEILAWFYAAVICPLGDFVARPGWAAVLIFVVGYKLGEGMAGAMAAPFYLWCGYSFGEIAEVSKTFGMAATVSGGLLGGAVISRFGTGRALLLFGLLQSLGNFSYILQARAGHDLGVFALCVAAENLSGGMAGTALVVYVSRLCRLPYTATQYALMSSIMVLGRTAFSATGGVLSERLGWEGFFLLTTLISLPALLLFVWMERRWPTSS